MPTWMWWLAACAEPADGAPAAHVVIRGARLAGAGTGPVDVELRDGRITAVGTVRSEAEVVDGAGRWLAPAAIDSHVHLVYLPEGDAMADGGVGAVVDLATPLSRLGRLPKAPRTVFSGPMLTAAGGYPENSWGAGGYGLFCEDAPSAVAAVDRLHDAGATVLKLALAGEPTPPDEALRAAVGRAHELGMVVVAHALDDASAARAAAVGADGLAHTPVEPLTPETIAAWRGRTVISTLRAFGGYPSTVANLRALREAGATVLYGTDFGNTRDAGVDPAELALLQQAGLDGAAILAAMTAAPATRWGLDDLGTIAVGNAASVVLLDADPVLDPSTWDRPVQVWIDGRLR